MSHEEFHHAPNQQDILLREPFCKSDISQIASQSVHNLNESLTGKPSPKLLSKAYCIVALYEIGPRYLGVIEGFELLFLLRSFHDPKI